MRWLTADEAYGRCAEFREAVAGFGLTYVVEIPTDLTGWTRIPEVLPSGTIVLSGRRLRKPRVAENQAKARPVKDLWRRGGPSWDFYRIKDSDKGPVVWEVRESRFYPNRNGVPGCEARLIVARNLLDDEIKYFLSNADMAVPLEALLHVAFSRCHIEQIFREGKGTVGLDEFQVRNYLPLQRHLAMTLVSLLFLAEQTAVLRGEKSPLEPLPSPGGDRSPTGTDDVAA